MALERVRFNLTHQDPGGKYLISPPFIRVMAKRRTTGRTRLLWPRSGDSIRDNANEKGLELAVREIDCLMICPIY